MRQAIVYLVVLGLVAGAIQKDWVYSLVKPYLHLLTGETNGSTVKTAKPTSEVTGPAAKLSGQARGVSCAPAPGVEPKVVNSVTQIESEVFGYWLVPVQEVDPETMQEAYIELPPGGDTHICTTHKIPMFIRFVHLDGSTTVLDYTQECIEDHKKCDSYPKTFIGMHYKATERNGLMEVRIYKK